MFTFYHLVLITCLHGACKEQRDPEWVYAGSTACVVSAQLQFSVLQRQDPRLRLKTFRCEPGRGEST